MLKFFFFLPLILGISLPLQGQSAQVLQLRWRWKKSAPYFYQQTTLIQIRTKTKSEKGFSPLRKEEIRLVRDFSLRFLQRYSNGRTLLSLRVDRLRLLYKQNELVQWKLDSKSPTGSLNSLQKKLAKKILSQAGKEWKVELDDKGNLYQVQTLSKKRWRPDREKKRELAFFFSILPQKDLTLGSEWSRLYRRKIGGIFVDIYRNFRVVEIQPQGEQSVVKIASYISAKPPWKRSPLLSRIQPKLLASGGEGSVLFHRDGELISSAQTLRFLWHYRGRLADLPVDIRQEYLIKTEFRAQRVRKK
ncbi:MAG: hypothetical protein D6805_03365 [Planctomycetota bacterium]|nr:MAG: hypothetical protein D6805_03365 [Planctomycetota bacterium]